MKLIHLADLHIGKRVNEFSMIEDQKYILLKILNIIDEEKPDGHINVKVEFGEGEGKVPL